MIRLLNLVLMSTAVATAHGGSIFKPKDTSNAIGSYEILGVRLGMSEGDAIAAIRSRFPAGAKDANGRLISLKQSDYQLVSPQTRAEVRAGIRFDLYPASQSNFDFIKIFLHQGKVWAVWRDDMSGRYDYEQISRDLHGKYAAASPIHSRFMIVNNNSIAPQPGDPATHGAELFEGDCLTLPFKRSHNSDSISLDPRCRKAFTVDYQPQHKNGTKILASGFGQLVDLDVGRSFMKWMATGVGNIYSDKPRTTATKL
jgi:hypothetical protein